MGKAWISFSETLRSADEKADLATDIHPQHMANYNLSLGATGAGNVGRAGWENVQRTWDQVEEGADGTLGQAIESLQDANKRRR